MLLFRPRSTAGLDNAPPHHNPSTPTNSHTMFTFRLVSALAAAALLSMASADDASSSSKIVSIPTPTKTVAASAMQTIGCFETGVPLEDHGKGNFVTAGSCQQICLGLEKNVLGLSEGDHCWCGDEYPPKAAMVDNSTCSTTCSGDDRTTCGGHNLLWVMSTGNSRNEIQYHKIESESSSSSSTTSSKTAAVPTSSTAAETGTVSTPTAEPEKKGPNTVGIAVGVVVGVLVLAAIIGGVFFFLRRQRRQAVEEEYRRQAAVNSFVSGGKLHTSNSSMTDSRLDPEFMARRQSNGSIADNEDYSRRILKVTNA